MAITNIGKLMKIRGNGPARGRSNLKRAFLLILPIFFFTLGCMGKLECRHEALQMASLGVEKHLETRISVYKVNHPMWDAHAQAQVKVDGKWKWMTEWYGYVIISDQPSFTPSGYVLFFSIPEYLEVLKKGSYSVVQKGSYSIGQK